MFYLNIIITFIVSYLFIKIIIKYAKQLGCLDIPNHRSYHCSIIPKGGGIGFMGAFLLSIILFHRDIFIEYWYIFVAIISIMLIGMIDDKKEVSPKLKFIVIFGGVMFISLFDIKIDHLGFWFGYEVMLPIWISLPFTMFAVAGFTNALNLIDGIDGLAGSISTVIITIFLFIGYIYEDSIIIILASTMLFSLSAFLWLNWNPASIFMGDSGSLTLGFFISILAMLSLKYIHPVATLYIAALPILDTLIVMTRRINDGKSPFEPDKSHLHHIVVKFFNSDVKKSVIFLVILQMLFSIIGLLISNQCGYTTLYTQTIPILALLGFLLLFLFFYLLFTGIYRRQKIIDKRINQINIKRKMNRHSKSKEK